MNSTGIVRQVDELGRIVIPKELRFTLGINLKDPLEFYLDTEAKNMMLKAYTSTSCIFCGELETVKHFKGKLVCNTCLQAVKVEVQPVSKAKVKHS
jgi:transcriptional pleiotropic regulator of transition state genes